MADKICVMACPLLFAELKKAVQGEGLENVKAAAYQQCCTKQNSSDKNKIPEINIPHGFSKVYILACEKLPHMPGYETSRPDVQIHKVSQSFYRFLNKSLVDALEADGAYLITPEWTPSWKDRLAGMGFDKKTAVEFFAESCKKVVLLDTGVNAAARENAEEFARYIDRPCEILPIGLDFFSNHLKSLIYTGGMAALEDKLTGLKKTNANYAMYIDVVKRIALANTEKNAIDNILNIFSELYAPEGIGYIPFKNGAAMPPHFFGAYTKIDLPDVKEITEKKYTLTPSGKGFWLAIKRKDSLLGIIKIENIVDSDNINQTVDNALLMADVCSLIMENAQFFEEQKTMIAELNELQDELNMKYSKLKESEEGRNQLLGVLTHDLRTPLVSIKGYSKLLANGAVGAVNEEQKKMLETIENNVEKQARLINEILESAKAESGNLEIVKKEIDLVKVMAETLKELKGAASGKAIILNENIKVKSLITRADQFRVWQMLGNILNNSIKFSSEGGLIEFFADKVKFTDIIFPNYVDVKKIKAPALEYIYISIKDNGPGIAPDDICKLFERFAQTCDPAQKKKGTGLGLYMARQIAEMHNGLIWVKSEGLGKGSEFNIILPVL